MESPFSESPMSAERFIERAKAHVAELSVANQLSETASAFKIQLSQPGPFFDNKQRAPALEDLLDRLFRVLDCEDPDVAVARSICSDFLLLTGAERQDIGQQTVVFPGKDIVVGTGVTTITASVGDGVVPLCTKDVEIQAHPQTRDVAVGPSCATVDKEVGTERVSTGTRGTSTVVHVASCGTQCRQIDTGPAVYQANSYLVDASSFGEKDASTTFNERPSLTSAVFPRVGCDTLDSLHHQSSVHSGKEESAFLSKVWQPLNEGMINNESDAGDVAMVEADSPPEEKNIQSLGQKAGLTELSPHSKDTIDRPLCSSLEMLKASQRLAEGVNNVSLDFCVDEEIPPPLNVLQDPRSTETSAHLHEALSPFGADPTNDHVSDPCKSVAGIATPIKKKDEMNYLAKTPRNVQLAVPNILQFTGEVRSMSDEESERIPVTTNNSEPAYSEKKHQAASSLHDTPKKLVPSTREIMRLMMEGNTISVSRAQSKSLSRAATSPADSQFAALVSGEKEARYQSLRHPRIIAASSSISSRAVSVRANCTELHSVFRNSVDVIISTFYSSLPRYVSLINLPLLESVRELFWGETQSGRAHVTTSPTRLSG